MSRWRKGRRTALVLGSTLLVLLALGAWFLRDHLAFLIRFEKLVENPQGLLEYRHRRTGIVMVRIPGGTFLMGSPARSHGVRTAEQPQHEVTVSAFLLSKYEVTQSQWLRVIAENPSLHRGDDIPVNRVTWKQCRDFCEKAGLSLPTEAQWEWACRAGDRSWSYRVHPAFDGRIGQVFGSDGQRLDGMTPQKLREFTRELGRVAWFGENSGDRPHPVGRKEPNDFGLYDMLGNVAEFCEDIYDREFYSRPEATRPDPVCAGGSERRVLRGGSFWSKTGLQLYRSTSRFAFPPELNSSPIGFLGFRVAYPLRR